MNNFYFLDPNNIMNIINSMTGLNMNFNLGGNMGNFNNPQNINIQGNYNFNGDEDYDDGDEEENEDDEENEGNENYDENNLEEMYIKKRNKFILELDEFQFKHVKKYSTIIEDKCAICLQKYKGIDIIKEFPCKHIFHKNCILKWIKSSNICPLCKYDITNDVNKIDLKSYNEEDEERKNN